MPSFVGQPPIRNPSTLAASVFGHSGEFGPTRTDLSLQGRGLHFAFVRSYRSSLADSVGELGRGWSASISKRLEATDDELLLYDGGGLVHRFTRQGSGYASPTGYYGVIAKGRSEVVLRHRHGIITRFDPPTREGRIRSVEDRNGNVIRFDYRSDRIEILDTLRRQIDVTLAKGRIQEVRDHAGRKWNYVYDGHDRLVEVVQPVTRNSPAGTILRYGYDETHRLRSITDAKGQTWLVVRYDDAGRVVEQTHGIGTYTFKYESNGRSGSAGVRVTCGLKNGGTLVVDHDPAGHPVSRTTYVRRTAFAPEDVADTTGDVVLLVSTSSYNQHGERVSRTEPAGNSINWVYAEDDEDPRNRGNCLIRTETPAPGVTTEQASLVTTWTYDCEFQIPLSVTDPRGNTTTYRYDAKGNRTETKFAPVTVQPVAEGEPDRPAPITLDPTVAYAFNSRGQLLRKTHIDGTVTTFEYYRVADPTGSRGLGSATADPDAICGYLATVTHDTFGGQRRTGYRWDMFGNAIAVLDSQRNAVRLRYDELGRLERVDGRGAGSEWIEYRYDANGNEIEAIQPFERLEVDEASGELVPRVGTVRELRSYDVLDRLVTRTIAGGDTSVTERFLRDADGRIVRLVQPTGSITEIEYDERDLPITSTRAAGTKDAVTERRAYTANGDLRSETDGRGGTTLYHYDGFGRHIGTTDRLGTHLTLSLDEGGNVVRLAVEARGRESSGEGEGGKRFKDAMSTRRPLIETFVRYDEWNRPVRIDEAWRDSTGRALGRSGWDGQEGVSSTIVEYLANGRPGRVWNEAGNVVTMAYDGLGQIASISDLTGEQAEFLYDPNGNPTAFSYRMPGIDRSAQWSTVRLHYDEMDRLVARHVDDDALESLAYDAMGGVNGHRRASGLNLHLLHDALGRRVGQLLVVGDARGRSAARILRRFEYDDAYRLTAHTDGAGNRTTYRYDALDRQVGIVYPDGTEAIAQYDSNGNVVRTVDPRGAEITLSYDEGDRLVERRCRQAGSDATNVDSFEYDAVGRLVRATTAAGELQQTYDSLSRVLTESQAGRTVLMDYDGAGRAVGLGYPGGERIRRTFDVRGRVTAVTGVGTEAETPIASIEYRAGEHVARLALGGTVQATCAYDGTARLESVTYTRRTDGALIEGFRYAYDDANRIVSAVQLSDGVGEYYEFDAANRPIRARYGIRDALDPASPFELETTYEYFPEGPWLRRRDQDGGGVIIADQHGTIDARNRYRKFGGTSFAYDAAGNTIRKGTDNPGFCLHTYDAQNRLTKSECFDANTQRTRTIEYEYDALGRLVRKTVTDRLGTVTVIEFVWSGGTLLEEYENGVLARTYVYSIGTAPARLTVNRGGRTDYWYVHDGRGLVAGLVRATDPNAFAERYGYEITGFSFVKEIDGVKVDLPQRVNTASGLWNSVLAGDPFGTLMRDWANGTILGSDGRHLDPLIAAGLNTDAILAGGVHNTLKRTLGKQFESLLGMLGLGGRNNGFIARGGAGGDGSMSDRRVTTSGKPAGGAEQSGALSPGMALIMQRRMSLYSAGGQSSDAPRQVSLFPNSVQNPAFDFAKGGGGSSGTSGGSNGTSGGGIVDKVNKALDTVIRVGPEGGLETTVKDIVGGVVSGAAAGAPLNPNGPPKGNPPPPASSQQPSQEQEQARREREEREKKEKEQKEKEQKDKEGKEAKEKEEADKKKKDGKTYVDPDQQFLTATVTTPEQIELRLNGRKRPVNPNGGGWQTDIDTSSPPPSHGVPDPTLDRYDGETFGSLTLASGEPRVPIAPIRYVRDWEPPQPTFPPNGGGENERDTGVP